MFMILSLQTGNYILLRNPGQDLINQCLSILFRVLQPEFTAGPVTLIWALTYWRTEKKKVLHYIKIPFVFLNTLI